jgi:hypothetical protein
LLELTFATMASMIADVSGTLSASIDAVLAVDVDAMDNTELNRDLIALSAEVTRLHAAVLARAERWDARNVWANDGSRSAGHRLAREANTTVTAAKATIRRARALRDMPATREALQRGTITVDHVDLLANANSRSRCADFADDEASLVDKCETLRYAQARIFVEEWCNYIDALNGDDGTDPTREGREATRGRGINGEHHLKAIFDAVGGTIFNEAWDRIERELYRAEKNDPDAPTRTLKQRRADALVEMAMRATASQPESLRPRPLISVVLGHDSFKRLCQLSDGAVINPGSLVPWLGDADIESLIFDGNLHAIVKSTRRTFIGAVRRAIEVRDRHCQHQSGCDEPIARCDVDHIIARRFGGETSQDNGRLLCPTHNRDSAKRDPPIPDLIEALKRLNGTNTWPPP